MGAVLQPVDPDHLQADTAKRELTALSPFERPTEWNHSRALGQIMHLEAVAAHLEAEVRALREALMRAEHKIICQEQLLRNAQRREQELRLQMGELLK